MAPRGQRISTWSTASGSSPRIVRLTVDRLETIFSTSPSHPEGVANLAETMSEPIVESGYWGAMRDRLPITQTDVVAGSGVPTGSSSGARVVIAGQDNLALIRSGQDYSETMGPERDFFLNEIEPTLRAGMDFLRDDGRAIGCFANRYLDIVDEQERFVEKRSAISLWNDLAVTGGTGEVTPDARDDLPGCHAAHGQVRRHRQPAPAPRGRGRRTRSPVVRVP